MTYARIPCRNAPTSWRRYVAQVGDVQFATIARTRAEARRDIARQYREEFPASCGYFRSFSSCRFTWIGEPEETTAD